MIVIGLARLVTNHVRGLAEQSGSELPAYQVGRRHIEVVEEHAGPTGDIAGMYGVVRKKSGLKFENDGVCGYGLILAFILH